MKKQYILIALGICVLGILFLKFSNELSQSDQEGQLTQNISEQTKGDKSDGPSDTKPIGEGMTVTGSKQLDQKLQNEIDSNKDKVFHDPKKIGDPEYMKNLNRHFELKAYVHSEARDTPEFAEIEGLLKQFGYDQQYMRIAYGAAYEWHSEQKMDNQLRLAAAGDKAQEFEKVRGNAQEHIMNFQKNIIVKKMMFQGITNAPLIEMILDVKPTKFFGQREIFANEGEELILSVD